MLSVPGQLAPVNLRLMAAMNAAVQEAPQTASAPASAAPSQVLAPPALGEVWAGQGGRYGGISLTEDNRLCYLIFADEKPAKELTHQEALDWAVGLVIDGHKDFDLPTRHDGIVLFDNCRDRFELRWHWLKNLVTQVSGSAWCQHFVIGSQFWGSRNDTLRARAVRRLIIQ